MSINGVNFIIVHIISQAVLERRNYTVKQKEREPNFKPEYLVTQAELSIGFIPIERSFLCPSIELFWNSLIAYAKKKILKYFIALWKWNAADTWKFAKLYDSTETFLQCVRLVKWRSWSHAKQVRAEKLLGFIIQIQAQYLNVTGIGDLSETVRVILDKVVQEISQEIQSSSTPVVVCEWDGKMRLNTTFLNNNLSFT